MTLQAMSTISRAMSPVLMLPAVTDQSGSLSSVHPDPLLSNRPSWRLSCLGSTSKTSLNGMRTSVSLMEISFLPGPRCHSLEKPLHFPLRRDRNQGRKDARTICEEETYRDEIRLHKPLTFLYILLEMGGEI